MYMAKSAREIRNPPATPPSERRRRYDKDVVGDDDDEVWMGEALICCVQSVDLSHLEKRSHQQSCSCQLAHTGVNFPSNIKISQNSTC